MAARAQQPGRLVRIGFLSGGAGPNPNVYGFQHGLRQLGYVEGQNLVLIYRWAGAQRAPIVDLARELLELNVDVLASHTTEAIAAIRSLNTAIPVVMTAISDPIGNGLVASFARPGGNTTGVTLFSNELAGKRLEMLNQLVPQLRRVAILAERDRPPTATLVSETQAAAQTLRLALRTFEVRPEEIAEALRSIDKERADAVIVQQNLSFTPICGDRRPRNQLPLAYGSSDAGVRRSRRAPGLWTKPVCVGGARWLVCRPDSQGDETGRSSSRATDQVRGDSEPEDRKGSWPHHSRQVDGCGRRGDRVNYARPALEGEAGLSLWLFAFGLELDELLEGPDDQLFSL